MGTQAPGLRPAVRIGTVLCCLALTAPRGGASTLEPAPEGLDALQVVQHAERTFRGESRTLEATATIASGHRSRVVEFRAWDDRLHRRALIRILAPARDRGTAWLKLHPNLWLYAPRHERTFHVTPSMLRQAWMGSDFTHDDLVHGTSAVDDYRHRVLGYDSHPGGRGGAGAWVIEYVPREDAPIPRERIVAWIDKQHGTPLRREFFEPDGGKLRVLRFDDIRSVRGRRFPHRWEMTPLDEKGHETVIEVHAVRFDEPIDESVFSTRNLKEAERAALGTGPVSARRTGGRLGAGGRSP